MDSANQFWTVGAAMNSLEQLRPAAALGMLPRQRHGRRLSMLARTGYGVQFSLRFGPMESWRRGDLTWVILCQGQWTERGTQRWSIWPPLRCRRELASRGEKDRNRCKWVRQVVLIICFASTVLGRSRNGTTAKGAKPRVEAWVFTKSGAR
jgi:hypothetical protein